MKGLLNFLLLFYCLSTTYKCFSQDVFKLWEGQTKPYYKENGLVEEEKETYGIMAIFNVSEPTLTVYRTTGENTGRAVVICPGGGYEFEAIHHEGYDIAKVLAEAGITAAVLKYRIPSIESSDEPNIVPLTDARRALQLLRDKADDYGITSDVGIMGFSAGSHLATTVSLWSSDVPEENPDYSVFVYGVTNNIPGNIQWLEESLYHRKMTEEEIAQNTFLDLVTESTPPAFLVHAYDDNVCHVTESTLYAEKLFEHSVPLEMHLFTRGGHGFGGGKSEDGTDQWLPLFISWVKRL